MTEKQLQKKIDRLEETIAQDVSSSTLDLIYELVELNILLEAKCNK
jgi:hypothetical protein